MDSKVEAKLMIGYSHSSFISIDVLNKNDAQELRDLNSSDDVGGTLLHYTARSGFVKVVVCLLDAK